MAPGDDSRAVRALALVVLLAPALALAPACRRGAGPDAGAPASPAPAQPRGAADPDVAATVAKVIGAAHHPELAWPEIPDVAPVLKALYDAEPDGLVWFDGGVPAPGLAAAVAGLARADEHGLARSDHDADRLAKAWSALRSGEGATAAERALFDLALSASVARLLAAVHVGRVDPATLQWGYDVAPKALDRAAILRELRAGGDLQHALALLEPPFAHYARARRALAQYRAAARRGEPEPLPPLPEGRRKLEPGDPWVGVTQLAARLAALGDLTAVSAAPAPDQAREPALPEATGPPNEAAADPGAEAAAPSPPATPRYDGALVGAVKRLQRRHGLEPDGVIGAATIEALDVPPARRARQLELAMERMRWLPKISTQPHVFVNVALFRLWATDPDSDREPLRMNVVVGKALDHRTPLFVERMEYVVFRPYWNPPYGIAVKEIVPRARRDVSYLARESLEIVAGGDERAPALPATPENLDKVVAGTLSVRQKPGPKNSLGLAKFIFPNDESVYMHGTPKQQLFSRARRDFSHGCIRLEDPVALAEWVLRDQPEWTRERILAAMAGERPTHVNLKQPVTVVLFYDTVHVNSEGVAFFVEDIYGHDAQLDAALRQGYPYPTKALP
jgi:murein L,D-transpeptidase YcbB/YkuD